MNYLFAQTLRSAMLTLRLYKRYRQRPVGVAARSLYTSLLHLVHLDWDRAAVHRLDAVEASRAEGARHLGCVLLLEHLELLGGELWQEAFDAEHAVECQVTLEFTLGKVATILRWNDELAGVVAGDGVLLVLDLGGGGDGDATLLGQKLALDLFRLESLDVKAQVEHARAVHWADVDRVGEGEEFSHRRWAERSVTDVRVELVPPRRLLAHPVRPVRAAHWHVRAPHWPV